MSPEIIGLLPHIQSAIEKLGIVGVMVVIVGYLIYDRTRMMKELRQTYRMRDKWRLAYVRAKSVLQQHGLTVPMDDMSDLLDELNGDDK